MNKLKLFLPAFVVISLGILTATPTRAAVVEKVTNNKAMINLEGESTDKNAIYFLLSKEGKKVGVVKVLQIKNDKAVVSIEKGSAYTGQKLLRQNASSAEVSASEKKSSGSSNLTYRADKARLSLLLQSHMFSMEALEDDGATNPIQETVSMKGNGFGLGAAIDYPVLDWMIFRGTVSYEPLSITGTAVNNVCNNHSSKDCNAKINYLSLAGFARFDFIKARATLWGGIGASYKYPISKSSTALKEADISSANTIIAALGLDTAITKSMYIPIVFEYHYSLNTSETVPKIGQMSLSAGLGFFF